MQETRIPRSHHSANESLAALKRGAQLVLAVSLVPGTVIGAICVALWAINTGVDPVMVVVPISFAALVWVAMMERILPYRREWNRSHGDIGTDALYYVTQILLGGMLGPLFGMLAVIIGGWLSAEAGSTLWPVHWPILAQVVLASIVREFFDYWAHRSMHHFDWLWRMHAIHHSVTRVYWLNALRAHPGEVAYRFFFAWVLPLSQLGATEEVLALTAVAALVADAFQHANIAIRLGPLKWVYSIGNLHRWHHSRERREADANYGNVYIFWDIVFGTRYLPHDREPPERVGIGGLEAFPRGFLAQMIAPFRWAQILKESASLSEHASTETRDTRPL